MLVSIVIRTLNESKYLDEVLQSISLQKIDHEVETIIIDSGSTDSTIEIAKKYNSRITYIKKDDFTFGRSLNMGTNFADGEIIVYLSGHCIPTDRNWLTHLIDPIINNISGYAYGRQVGRDTTKFSETRIFDKYFPKESKIPQTDFFCNNANSAISRNIWSKYKFNEKITGLEDMELSKRYFDDGGSISYVSEASVYHIHNETWSQTKTRYEREAIAMKDIIPDLNINFFDMVRYVLVSIFSDILYMVRTNNTIKGIAGIIKFRIAQYYGSYIGNHESRELSKIKKENYYYPIKKK